MTGKDEFELVTASFNDKYKPEPVSTTRKNSFELVTASFNDNQKEPVWASYS